MSERLKRSDFAREEANAKSSGKPYRGIIVEGVYNGKEYSARFILDNDEVREAADTPVWTKVAGFWFTYKTDADERRAILEAIKPELEEPQKGSPRPVSRTFEGTYDGKEYSVCFDYAYPDGVQTVTADAIWCKSIYDTWIDYTPKDKAEHDAIIAALTATGGDYE